MSQSAGSKYGFWWLWNHQGYVRGRLRRTIEQLLPSNAESGESKRIVDFGCGEHPYESLFRGFGYTCVACDLNGNVDVIVKPGEPLAIPDGKADGLVSVQVLEHVWDLDWYFGECRRLLTPDGWLLLSTHGSWLYHPHPTDYRRWTRDGLLRELTDRGFEVLEVKAIIGPLAWTTLFRLFGIRHALMGIPALGKILVPPMAFLMNIRMILEDAMTPRSIRDVNAAIYVVLARKRMP